ncbi:MAG: type II toxin-antitoxin system VapC family toxin [Anaerolineae bacterium]
MLSVNTTPKQFVLDTSALLALIEDEAGADRVYEIIEGHQAVVPWVALLEMSYITQQERGQAEAERRYAFIKTLPLTIVWEADEALLLQASRLRASHRISLGDSIIAAHAIRLKAVLLHKDPEFESLREKVVQETLPYKSRAKGSNGASAVLTGD